MPPFSSSAGERKIMNHFVEWFEKIIASAT
jgi:hypothetical protein